MANLVASVARPVRVATTGLESITAHVVTMAGLECTAPHGVTLGTVAGDMAGLSAVIALPAGGV